MVCISRKSSNDKLPSCGGNGGHRISVVHCPIGFLHPAAHRIAAADSHRCFFLLQMDPPVPSSDLTSAPKKSPETQLNCNIQHLSTRLNLVVFSTIHFHIFLIIVPIETKEPSLSTCRSDLTCSTVLLGYAG